VLDTPTTVTFPHATDHDGNLLLSGEQAQQLLRECFVEFRAGMHELAAMSIETTNDLFEMNEHVSDQDAQEFRSKRAAWVKLFDETFTRLYDKRLAGVRRSGRRPDFDASLTTLRVLNAFDQEKQAALTAATDLVRRVTRREVAAVDLRVGVLLKEPRARAVDNPLSPDYVIDAIGVASRSLYPNPRIWRPLMERVLADVTPSLRKHYIRVNRFLADHHVLPEIKAELRARSDHRPADDAELLPVFQQMLKEAGPSAADELLALNVAVPDLGEPSTMQAPQGKPFAAAVRPAAATPPTAATPSAAPAPQAAAAAPMAAAPAVAAPMMAVPAAVAQAVAAMPWLGTGNPYATDFARPVMVAAPTVGAHGLPQLDPMLALGSLSTAVAALDRWQHADPGGEYVAAQDLPAGAEVTSLPLNRIPYIRAAISDKIVNTTDKITMDVIALLFDYIFRDPSIPDSLRSLFSRLQVPILKTALLDRSFFSNRKHPARRLLDHLAAASIGATSDAGYSAAFQLIATGLIDEICRDFKVDMVVFETADVRLQEFSDAEQRKVTVALDAEVEEVLSAEKTESDRAHVRVFIRDKLAGLEVPFDVRAFSETVWADYLTEIRATQGANSAGWHSAVKTLDDLLWSVAAKERTAQKARLAGLVPTMIRNIRLGAAAVKGAADRVQPLLDVMFKAHMAAIKPKAAAAAAPAPTGGAPAKAATPGAEGTTVPGMRGTVMRMPDGATLPGVKAAGATGDEGSTVTGAEGPASVPVGNVHDFVNEMVVGTWLAFGRAGKTTNARLSWISPLRSKYIFTSRARTKAIVVTPEELAYQLGAGKASLIVEPVPLFDRAVSSALDSIAARKPVAGAAAAA